MLASLFVGMKTPHFSLITVYSKTARPEPYLGRKDKAMIVIENAPRYAVYCRTNRRVRWKYATYAGSFDTIEAAIEDIKKHLPGKSFEYLAEDTETGEEIFGIV